MKLFMHPVSTAARPIRLFIAENGIACEEVFVDLMTGAHLQEAYASLNPNQLVPMLDDDGFRLTESSAILKYLADKFELPSYPKDLRERARFVRVSPAGLSEGHPHGVGITREAPNYQRNG